MIVNDYNEQQFCTEIGNASRTEGWRINPIFAESKIEEICKKYGKAIVAGGKGQNRIVVTPGRKGNDSVYKIAYRSLGVADNKGEYAISQWAISSANGATLMKHLPMVDDFLNPNTMFDGVIICSEKVLSWTQHVISTYGETNVGKNGVAELFTKNWGALKAATDLFDRYFLPVDKHPKNPFNYGLKNTGGEWNLCNIDYGYWLILEKLKQVKPDIMTAHGVKCPACNSPNSRLISVLPNSTGDIDSDLRLLTSEASGEDTEQFICSSCNKRHDAAAIWSMVVNKS